MGSESVWFSSVKVADVGGSIVLSSLSCVSSIFLFDPSGRLRRQPEMTSSST